MTASPTPSQQIIDEVRDVPGVRRVGVGFPVPLTGVSMSQRVSLGALNLWLLVFAVRHLRSTLTDPSA